MERSERAFSHCPHLYAAGCLLAFADDRALTDDQDGLLALGRVARDLLKKSGQAREEDSEADTLALLDAIAGFLDQQPFPRHAHPPAVEVTLGTFKLADDQKRRTMASCLLDLKGTRMGELGYLLALEDSPLVAWFQGNHRDRHDGILDREGDDAHSPEGLIRAFTDALVASTDALQSPGAPEEASKVVRMRPSQENTLQLHRFAPDSAPKFAPLRRQRLERTEEGWTADNGALAVCRHYQVPIVVTAAVGLLLAVLLSSLLGSRDRSASSQSLQRPEVIHHQDPLEIAEKFVYAAHHAERVPLLRHPQDARLMHAHFEAMKASGQEQNVDHLRPVSPAIIQGMNVHRFHVRFDDGRDRLLALVQEGESLKVDWRAYERHGNATWQDLLSNEVEEGDVRCLVEECQYFNFDFDEEHYRAYAITSPDLEEPVYGYVRKGLHRELIVASAVFPGSKRRLALRLQAIEGSEQHRQFLISKVISLGWVVGEVDFEDSPFAAVIPSEFGEMPQGNLPF